MGLLDAFQLWEFASHAIVTMVANAPGRAASREVPDRASGRSREALAAARDHPGVAERIREAGQIADGFAPIQYELRRSVAAA